MAIPNCIGQAVSVVPNAAALEAVAMGKQRIKPNYRRRLLRLPDLDHCKLQVLNSLVSWAFTHLYVGSPALLKLNPKAQLCLERRPDDANRFSRESHSQRTILSGVNWYWWLCGSKPIGTRY
jgi:hypothetical protein